MPVSEMLRIDDAECAQPTRLQGDLYLVPDRFMFACYRKGAPSLLLLMFFTFVYYIVRSIRMNKWRLSLEGKPMEQIMREAPGSWSLAISDVLEMQKRFPATLIIHTRQEDEYRLSVPRWQDFQRFAVRHNWPLK